MLEKNVKNLINSPFCKCGQEIKIDNRTGPLRLNTDKNFYGGNVEGFFNGECPSCGENYELCTQQGNNTWKVLALIPSESVEDTPQGDIFDTMIKQDLKEWLEQRGVPYTANWGDKRLREVCRENI